MTVASRRLKAIQGERDEVTGDRKRVHLLKFLREEEKEKRKEKKEKKRRNYIIRVYNNADNEGKCIKDTRKWCKSSSGR